MLGFRYHQIRAVMYKAHLTPFIPSSSPHPLLSSLPPSPKPPKVGTTRVLFDRPQGALTALTSLGEDYTKKKPNEQKERVRVAIGNAVKAIKGLGDFPVEAEVNVGAVDDSSHIDAHAAAEAAHLALYSFTLKTSPPSPFNPALKQPIPDKVILKPSEPSTEWDTGVIYAQAQNFSRTMMELPANMCTPTIFTDRVKAEFANIPNVEVRVHSKDWAEEKGMRTFLAVAKGSAEPPKFLEIIYRGAPSDDRPIAFVGKGVTFDSGGISLKPSNDMKEMRSDMGGAAAVVSATMAIAKLKLPLNIVATVPLCENLPGPTAVRPGDIVYTMSGKTVEVDDTDAEGRLILSDALYYTATEYKPHTLIDVATLTGAMGIALGNVFVGVFTTSDVLWSELHGAGEAEFDRFWRMPLDDGYLHQITGSNADLCNKGGRPAGSCTAAMFLKAFVPEEHLCDYRWAHVDMAGAMDAKSAGAYQEKGKTGRPVRALIEWARHFCEVRPVEKD